MINKKAYVNSIKKKYNERLVVFFLDIIVLKYFESKMFSGYDVLRFVRSKFGFLLSSGTCYTTLYAMERRHLLEVVFEGRKRVYKVSANGAVVLELVTQSEVCSVIHSVFHVDDSKK